MSKIPCPAVSTIQEEDEDEDRRDPLWEDHIVPNNEDGGDAECQDEIIRDSYRQGYHKSGMQYIPEKGFKRYSGALRNLILVRRKKKKKGSLGVDEAGLWSFITYGWLSKYIYQAYKNDFSMDDIPEGSPFDSSEYNVQRLQMLWQEELAKKGPQSASLGQVTWRFMRTRVIVAAIAFIVYIFLCFISVAIFMRGLLQFAESENASVWDGVMWAVLLTLSELLRITCYSMVWALNYRTAVRLRSACLAMLYRKILRLTCLKDKTVGELINLFSTDGQRIFDLVLFGPMVIGAPISIILCLFYTFWQLGIWAMIGLLTFFIFYPIQYGLSRLSGLFKRKAVAVTDKRINAMSEILQSIKLIKLYVWNIIFSKRILDIRKRELTHVGHTAYCHSMSSSVSAAAPMISAIVAFLAHIAAGNTLSASQAFTVISLCERLMKNVLNFTRDGFKSIVDFNITLRRFKAFPIVIMLSTFMRLSFTYLHYGLSNIIELNITCSRLQSVLLLDETKVYLSRPLDKSQSVSIANASFARYSVQLNDTKRPNKNKNFKAASSREENELLTQSSPIQNVLFNINFYAPKGKLIGVCGQVGSGKSSLLNAILGQLSMTKGKLCREGSCAYVSQQPWLLNATLRENILFGEKFVGKKYFNALYCCSLNEDINLLPGGDETEIGERGINLSGGQKQRVALARALYADRDIYLLDDPLSAVDVHVGAHIFEKYIKRALRSKTVVFVTHQIQYLNQCDDIVVMKEGRIVERGAYNELLDLGGEFKIMSDSLMHFQETVQKKGLDLEASQNLKPVEDPKINPDKNGILISQGAALKNKTMGQLTTDEKVQKGSLKLDTILSYMRASGGLFISSLVVLLMLANVGSSAFSSWWLALWIKEGIRPPGLTKEDHSISSQKWHSVLHTWNSSFSKGNVTEETDGNNATYETFYYYRFVYMLSIGIILLTNIARVFACTKVTLKASSKIHNRLLAKLLKSPMSFFEVTPIGRIHNLFSKDIDEIEVRLPMYLESLIQDVWKVVFAALFICLVFPYFVFPMALLAFVYYLISKIFRVGIRDLKRIENLSRSPIFSIVSTTVNGLPTIHAFQKEKDFINKFTTTFDQNTTCLYMCSISQRWLALRLDGIAVFIMLITSSLVILLHGQVPPSMAGLAIAYAATISGMFQYTIRLVAECEARFLSVERINSYIQGLEQEGGHGPKGVPPETWPELGTIRFQNVILRYRPGLPNALNHVSFKIRSGEKIGIVGRTGSGKSSLTSALFRLVEINGGSIKIDNLDIATLNIDILRSRLTIIPQDPILFSGTIRTNLDPGGFHDDASLWSALEKTKLKERVSSQEGKLDTQVLPSGDNFSVGERQLLCLARALLRQSKIVVLDEATSGIDPDTESIVQQTIHDEFRQCTVLTIAHRLETLNSCNRLLVMDNGMVAEFDTPMSLLQNQDSLLSKLIENSNLEGSGT